MQNGAPVNRGILNGNSGNNAFDKSIAEKFKKPLSEFDHEKMLESITPRDHMKRKQIIDYLDYRISQCEKNSSIQIAYSYWRTKLDVDSLEGKINNDFTKEFQRWLLGIGSIAEHQKTPWGRKRVDDPEVKNYLKLFLDARLEFMRVMETLWYKAKMGLIRGVNEHYLFYKYLVRGGLKFDRTAPDPYQDADESDWLVDWRYWTSLQPWKKENFDVLKDVDNPARGAVGLSGINYHQMTEPTTNTSDKVSRFDNYPKFLNYSNVQMESGADNIPDALKHMRHAGSGLTIKEGQDKTNLAEEQDLDFMTTLLKKKGPPLEKPKMPGTNSGPIPPPTTPATTTSATTATTTTATSSATSTVTTGTTAAPTATPSAPGSAPAPLQFSTITGPLASAIKIVTKAIIDDKDVESKAGFMWTQVANKYGSGLSALAEMINKARDSIMDKMAIKSQTTPPTFERIKKIVEIFLLVQADMGGSTKDIKKQTNLLTNDATALNDLRAYLLEYGKISTTTLTSATPAHVKGMHTTPLSPDSPFKTPASGSSVPTSPAPTPPPPRTSSISFDPTLTAPAPPATTTGAGPAATTTTTTKSALNIMDIRDYIFSRGIDAIGSLPGVASLTDDEKHTLASLGARRDGQYLPEDLIPILPILQKLGIGYTQDQLDIIAPPLLSTHPSTPGKKPKVVVSKAAAAKMLENFKSSKDDPETPASQRKKYWDFGTPLGVEFTPSLMAEINSMMSPQQLKTPTITISHYASPISTALTPSGSSFNFDSLSSSSSSSSSPSSPSSPIPYSEGLIKAYQDLKSYFEEIQRNPNKYGMTDETITEGFYEMYDKIITSISQKDFDTLHPDEIHNESFDGKHRFVRALTGIKKAITGQPLQNEQEFHYYNFNVKDVQKLFIRMGIYATEEVIENYLKNSVWKKFQKLNASLLYKLQAKH